MNNPRFIRPKASEELYRWNFVLIWAAFFVPLPFLALDVVTGKDWFHRSGAIVLFLVAFSQFWQLHALQEKHFHNALRAMDKEPIQILSWAYIKLEKWTFGAGLYGTGIWAYGDKLTEALRCACRVL